MSNSSLAEPNYSIADKLSFESFQEFITRDGNQHALEDRIPPIFKQVRDTDPVEKFVVEYLNSLFQLALNSKVSDIHFESFEQGHICRVRKDGVLAIYGHILTEIQFSVIREKIFARGMVEESFAASNTVDTRAWLRFGLNRVDLRISSVPTTHGYTIVIRLLDQSNSGRRLDEIEMKPEVRSAILEVIQSAHGLILLTGPTGSGKTTTLYSFLNELNTIERKTFTIENPVEYTIPNVQHVNVDQNITFNKALRAALRQDPDIILVGEIRDSETAKTAVEAAQTGHLVLSTLHTNSSVGAIGRLLELGVDRGHINETLLAVCGQRLVRRCKDTRNLDEASEAEREWLRKNGFSQHADGYFGRGISKENYKGRLPVLELLLINDEIREKISTNKISDIYELAKKQKSYQTLTEAAIDLALEGKTSLEQAMSISSASSLMNMDGMLMGERLVALNYLTPYQLEIARQLQREAPEISRKKLKDILLEKHLCSIEQLREVEDAPDA